MSVVYSLYDALVSINVPDEKAKAVIDALEREMMDKLATKADLENLRIATKADIENLRIATKADIDNLRASTKGDIDNLRAATKADFANLRLEFDSLRASTRADIGSLRLEIENLRASTKADIGHLRELLSKDIHNLSNAMTIRLGTISGMWAGVLFALLKLTA